MTAPQNLTGDQFEHAPVPRAESSNKLKVGAIGLFGVLFMAVANAAPITAMTGNVPIAVAFGNGIGAPAGFLVATIVLTLFTVGFIVDGSVHHHRRCLLRLHLARARPDLGYGRRGAGHHGLRRVRGLPDRDLLLLRQQRAQRLVRLEHQLADHRHHRHRGRSRSSATTTSTSPPPCSAFFLSARCSSSERSPSGSCSRAADPTASSPRRSTRQTPSRTALKGAGFGIEGLAAGSAAIGVFFAFWSWVGYRDDRGVRRGVAEPEEDRADGHAHRGGRPRPVLHLRLMDGHLRERRRAVVQAWPSPTASGCSPGRPTTCWAAGRSTSTSSSS